MYELLLAALDGVPAPGLCYCFFQYVSTSDCSIITSSLQQQLLNGDIDMVQLSLVAKLTNSAMAVLLKDAFHHYMQLHTLVKDLSGQAHTYRFISWLLLILIAGNAYVKGHLHSTDYLMVALLAAYNFLNNTKLSAFSIY